MRTTLPPPRAKASSSLASVCGAQGGGAAASRSRRMRRTVLRESFSRRLISCRLRPCSLRTRALLRISIAILLGIPVDLVAKGVKVRAQARHGVHQSRGQGPQTRQSLAQPRDPRCDAPQIDHAFAFGAGAQTLAEALLGTFLQGLDEQLRMADQPLARRPVRPLVMLEPAA